MESKAIEWGISRNHVTVTSLDREGVLDELHTFWKARLDYGVKGHHLTASLRIKVVDPSYELKYLNELMILHYLSGRQENVISLLDVGYSEGTVFFLFDDMESTLASAISNNLLQDHPIHRPYIAHQLLKGIQYCHACNIIICDLQPYNIKISGDCSVRIAEFGAARSVEPYYEPRHDTTVRRDPPPTLKTWWDVDMLFYSEPPLPRNDLWSLGCIVAEMYLGYTMFPLSYSLSNVLNAVVEFIGPISEESLNAMRVRSQYATYIYISDEYHHLDQIVFDDAYRRKWLDAKRKEGYAEIPDEALDFISQVIRWNVSTSASDLLEHKLLTDAGFYPPKRESLEKLLPRERYQNPFAPPAEIPLLNETLGALLDSKSESDHILRLQKFLLREIHPSFIFYDESEKRNFFKAILFLFCASNPILNPKCIMHSLPRDIFELIQTNYYELTVIANVSSYASLGHRTYCNDAYLLMKYSYICLGLATRLRKTFAAILKKNINYLKQLRELKEQTSTNSS